MKPIIGITSSIREERLAVTGQDYIQAIAWAGGVPVVLPNLSDEASADKIAATIDGLLSSGGKDIDPTLFGEEPHPRLGEVSPERDRFESMMIARMLQLDKPILGICRGCQILNVVQGGDMYQDIHAQHEQTLLQHQQVAPRYHGSHYIDVCEGSLLHQITGSLRYKVNSYHHQAVRKMADGFEICARASDGIVEAFASVKHRFVIGVQWHPENLLRKEDIYSQKLFEAFVQACSSAIKDS
ncbi:gamma-glutamyl-gamma-aminobutyrate hydrolase family protein [Paenibacillus sp. J2TS4]|uniref:gamma-glutamyl-gamma-aminobutyrate hydrolase family protein n=1 Tax=Paenibacillus sp. J2TS4 TaxID=2807194 RepID=UPI001AFE0051|nr:gamma-glutamyl-gamma-aminobutyrate hydrolase family protein [Paenibacillus sp. J2TS4]GIP33434.1 gamma-glutamyl-gamma-aminobutyrate hydrolase [Paenibacillus sp. J2TS4]